MSAYYDLYETPDVQNTGEKQPLHARIVPSGTYSQKEFIERVSRYQHFPQNTGKTHELKRFNKVVYQIS